MIEVPLDGKGGSKSPLSRTNLVLEVTDRNAERIVRTSFRGSQHLAGNFTSWSGLQEALRALTPELSTSIRQALQRKLADKPRLRECNATIRLRLGRPVGYSLTDKIENYPMKQIGLFHDGPRHIRARVMPTEETRAPVATTVTLVVDLYKLHGEATWRASLREFYPSHEVPIELEDAAVDRLPQIFFPITTPGVPLALAS